MGKLIDEIEIYKRLRPKTDNGTLDEIMLDIPTVEAIPKAQYDELKANITMMRLDYEARLKADLVAMLTELKKEIEELQLDKSLMSRNERACYGIEPKLPKEIKQNCVDIIQQKINNLQVNNSKVKEDET